MDVGINSPAFNRNLGVSFSDVNRDVKSGTRRQYDIQGGVENNHRLALPP